MSKKSKLASRELRKRAKRSKKDSNQKMFSDMAGSEANKKKKGSSVGGRSSAKHQHAVADCGNPGCTRCFPRQVPW